MSTYESLKEQRYQHEWVIAGAFPHRLIAVFDASDGWSVRFYVESKGGGNLPTRSECNGLAAACREFDQRVGAPAFERARELTERAGCSWDFAGWADTLRIRAEWSKI